MFVGQNIPLDSAAGHASGASVFLDDVAPMHGEVFVGIAGSPVARGRIKKLDLSMLGHQPGVVGVYTHKDIPGHNRFGPVVHDEDLLVADEAQFIGQPIVIIAAESREALRNAQQWVRVEMEELEPVLSIERAIELNQFLSTERKIERGNIASAFAANRKTLEGVFDIGGQEHFYLESQISIVLPGEYNTYTVHSSTQHTTEVQSLVAEVLGVPFNHVTCICKRMGGGFGGKETQAAQPAMMAAIVAHHLKRPARFAYNKDDDMAFTGKRHPFKVFWKAAFDSAGVIHGVDLQLYSDGGCSTDLSMAIMERALLHSDNAYYFEHFRARGRVCKTNLPSNTAFRGFGGPQGVAAIENIIEEVARELGIDAMDVRQRNVYREGKDETPYNQRVGNNTLPALFENIRRDANYDARRREVDEFNAKSKTHVKGLATTAVKFGISFTRKALNQANALVNIYCDGSVIVSTGATEMGQGVNTRIRQIVADELGVSYDAVIVAPTSTEKNNNTSPTAASSGTDLNGNAAMEACRVLRERLSAVAARMFAEHDSRGGRGVDGAEPTAPIRSDGSISPPIHNTNGDDGPPHDAIVFRDGHAFSRDPQAKPIPFINIVQRAFEDRIDLGARGYYFTPNIGFDKETGKGSPFYYFTNGVACSEVLIDRFTGEMRVTRVDLLMDIGRPINPGIDRGQITGGFIQGMGWMTTEELKYSHKGVLWSHSPTTYKIPNVSDVPEIFNINTLPNDDCAHSIKRSKAVGEPPLLLGFSVFAAVKDALRYAHGGAHVELSLPATNERIALALNSNQKSLEPQMNANERG